MSNIWLALITGLTTGGISCLAVQGGLLTSSMTQVDESSETRLGKATKVGSFLVAKIIAYTLLGFGLGALGSTLVLTPKVLGFMQIFAGVFMLLTAARLLNIHPIFRHFVIAPPKFVYRLIRYESKRQNLFAPAILGFLTILIPCGVTQAMMALAVASASPVLGAGIMFAFILGTSPVFLTIGVATLELLERKWFSYVAATVIFILAIVSVNTGQVLRGSVHTLQNYWRVFASDKETSEVLASVNGQGQQEVTIDVSNYGYRASSSELKAGTPVKLTLKTQNTQGCSRAFTIPNYNISKVLPKTGEEVVEFTPTKTGLLTYTCSMGMYTGQFTVVN